MLPLTQQDARKMSRQQNNRWSMWPFLCLFLLCVSLYLGTKYWGADGERERVVNDLAQAQSAFDAKQREHAANLQKSTDLLSDAKDEVKSLREKLTSSDATATQERESSMTHAKAAQDCQSRLDLSAVEAMTLQAKVKDLEASVAKAEGDASALRKDAETLRSKATSLQDEKHSLEEQRGALAAKLAQVEGERDTAQKALQAVQAEKAQKTQEAEKKPDTEKPADAKPASAQPVEGDAQKAGKNGKMASTKAADGAAKDAAGVSGSGGSGSAEKAEKAEGSKQGSEEKPHGESHDGGSHEEESRQREHGNAKAKGDEADAVDEASMVDAGDVHHDVHAVHDVEHHEQSGDEKGLSEKESAHGKDGAVVAAGGKRIGEADDL